MSTEYRKKKKWKTSKRRGKSRVWKTRWVAASKKADKKEE